MFLVWKNEDNAFGYKTLKDAIICANQVDGYVTQVVPAGDPRLIMIESLASGDLDYYGPVGGRIIPNMISKAQEAVREAAKFELKCSNQFSVTVRDQAKSQTETT